MKKTNTPPTLSNKDTLPNNDNNSVTMPPKKTTVIHPPAAKKAAPLSAAAMKSLPVPKHHIGANHAFAWTKEYTEAKE